MNRAGNRIASGDWFAANSCDSSVSTEPLKSAGALQEELIGEGCPAS